MGYAGALWAMERWLRDNRPLVAKIRACREEMGREFGWKQPRWSRRCSAGSCCSRWGARRERLERGWTYEPPTFYELNDAAKTLKEQPHAEPAMTLQPAEA